MDAGTDVGVGRHHHQRLVAVTRGRISHDGLLVGIGRISAGSVSAVRGLRQDPLGRGEGRERGVVGLHRPERVREHLDADRRGAPDRVEGPHDLDDVRGPFTGQQPRVHGLVGDVRRCLGKRVTELHREDAFTGERGDVFQCGGAARAVPRVDDEAAVRAVGDAHDLPRGVHVRERRPREELEVHEQPVLGGAVAHASERLDRGVEGRLAAPDLGDVHRATTDRVGDREELLVGRAHRIVDLERRVGRGARARQPRREAVELRDLEPVVVEQRADVGIAHALRAGSVDVGHPQRHARVPGRLRGLGALGEAGR